MTAPTIRKVQTKDLALSALQASVDALRTWLVGRPLVDAVELIDVDIATTVTAIPHRLGRVPRGWIITRKDAFADVKDASGDAPERLLYLVADGDVRATLVVF